MSKTVPIKEIFRRKDYFSQQEQVRVSGWVRSTRVQKSLLFITLNDGSTLDNLQLTVSSEDEAWEEAKKIGFAAGLAVSGKLLLTPDRPQPFELRHLRFLEKGVAAEDSPLQKQKLPLEVLRENANSRSKSQYFLALFRLRHSLTWFLHGFLQKQGFYNLPSPAIVSNDTEGGGESFFLAEKESAAFFGQPTNLTVSGQLHLEALAQGLAKVYSFNCCFRADKSHTVRHLAEFWMLEVEAVNFSLAEILTFTEKLVQGAIKHALKHNRPELLFFADYQQKNLLTDLARMAQERFVRLTYTQAVEILRQHPHLSLNWGEDFSSEQEKFLSEYFQKPLFITNYPASFKAFYMQRNPDQKTVANFDLILPLAGELVGGSVRENDYDSLQKRVKTEDLAPLQWYLDLRRFGYLQSSGFGLGFERLIMLISGVGNIKDVIPFPRFAGSFNY